jgi:hypothetical protein
LAEAAAPPGARHCLTDAFLRSSPGGSATSKKNVVVAGNGVREPSSCLRGGAVDVL